MGFILVAEGMGTAIPKGYLYFALGFASMIQALVLRAKASEDQLQALANREEGKDSRD